MTITTTSRLTANGRARVSLAAALAAPLLLLSLAGCAPGSTTPDSGPGTTADQPGSEADFTAARDEYDRKLARCLRDAGLDVKDPLPGEGIVEDSPEIRDAYPACAEEIGDPPLRDGITLTTEELDKLLDQATCLREMGYEIQEPTSSDPGFIPAEVSNEDFETCRVD